MRRTLTRHHRYTIRPHPRRATRRGATIARHLRNRRCRRRRSAPSVPMIQHTPTAGRRRSRCFIRPPVPTRARPRRRICVQRRGITQGHRRPLCTPLCPLRHMRRRRRCMASPQWLRSLHPHIRQIQRSRATQRRTEIGIRGSGCFARLPGRERNTSAINAQEPVSHSSY